MRTRAAEITQSYNQFARAYEHWHSQIHLFPIRVLPPKVSYLPHRGYMVAGRLYQMKADEIVLLFHDVTHFYELGSIDAPMEPVKNIPVATADDWLKDGPQ